YNFSVPQSSSRLFISMVNSGGAMVEYQGSFWVDSETLDLVRLEWKADHIPSSVGISSVTKSMHYKVMRVGDSDFLLPIHSELTSFDRTGRYRLNMVSRVLSAKLRSGAGEKVLLEEVALREPVMPVSD